PREAGSLAAVDARGRRAGGPPGRSSLRGAAERRRRGSERLQDRQAVVEGEPRAEGHRRRKRGSEARQERRETGARPALRLEAERAEAENAESAGPRCEDDQVRRPGPPAEGARGGERGDDEQRDREKEQVGRVVREVQRRLELSPGGRARSEDRRQEPARGLDRAEGPAVLLRPQGV